MKTPRITATFIILFILFVISIPLIEEQFRNQPKIMVYPELKQDTIKANGK